ncbi:MAG: hypothetical protein R8K47_05030 [Mariprofundaceae bacterium]
MRCGVRYGLMAWLMLACLPAQAADEWRVRIAPERGVAAQQAGMASSPARSRPAVGPISDAQAEALLDYRQPERVEAGMRARLKQHPNDARAWAWLARALEAQGRNREAAGARARARALGGAARAWHVSLGFSGFVDSNVVIAPNALHLAARDRGDIGARVTLRAGGRALERETGFLEWRLAYDDRVMQDFNSYALRLLAGEMRVHWRPSQDSGVWLGAGVQQATLGNAALFADWRLLAGVRHAVSEHDALRVDARWGRRNFSSGFNGFSSWRWEARHAWRHRAEALEAEAGVRVQGERTRQLEEAWRGAGGFASVLARGFRLGDGWIWMGGGLQAELRRWRVVDARPFLRASLKRRDVESGAFLIGQWRRERTLWGAKTGEIWFLRAEVRRNRSNMDAAVVIDPAQDRNWKRWRIEGGVQWRY